MIINANALYIPLADKSVQCIVTSPPYWGLRDYGTAKWEGGDPECKHEPDKSSPKSTLEGGKSTQGAAKFYRTICGKCDAIRIDNQLGLERTPEEYIANMVAVFRECWRVLRDDGTMFVNIGDSYWNGGGEKRDGGHGFVDGGKLKLEAAKGDLLQLSSSTKLGLKPKDLVGIPWRLAFALQADGWYLRSDIIWSKPNPMPESVTDRPTKSHEYLFLLAKQERYYYDQEAIREEYPQSTIDRMKYPVADHNVSAEQRGNGWVTTKNRDERILLDINPAGRNRRTVWTISTAPYKGAHFATFPPALVEPCIKAGTSERGACPKCGKGWRRVVEIKQIKLDNRETSGKITGGTSLESGAGNKNGGFHELPRTRKESNTINWQPSCTCDAGDPVPCLVFDPFVGSGTTVKVAYDLGRRGVGLDLSLDYLDEQARKRIHNGHIARLF